MSLSPEQFEQSLMRLEAELLPMLGRFLDTARIRLATTATEEYMRDSGHTSPPFPPRKKASGPLRILSGRLARSLTGGRSFMAGGNANSENVSEISSTEQGVKLTYGTNVPYASVHEQGFAGLVRVPAHQRTITQAFGKKIPAKTVTVREHRRSMFMPARPYLGPSLDDNRAWLEDKLAEETKELTLEVIGNA